MIRSILILSSMLTAPLHNEKVREPNELGRIPVVMYHAFGAPSSRGTRYDRMGLNIAPETFRKQLQLMYDAGWYPVNMRDILTPRIVVPAGKTPVVLTFDDARGTQFTLKKDGTLDPDCGLAIMIEFNKRHPDWPLKGSFYVLPESKYNPVPFYQKGKAEQKLRTLVDMGFEVANHSTTHRMMARLTTRDLAWEMAECIRYVKKVAPKATMDTMALPGGSVPRNQANLDVLLHGSDGPTQYDNLCILRAWGGPTLSPAHKKFDKKEILRIGTEPGNVEGWIKRLKPGSEMEPFVSDGDPNSVTVPRRLKDELAVTGLDGLKITLIGPDKPVKASSSKKKSDTSSKRGKTDHSAIPH